MVRGRQSMCLVKVVRTVRRLISNKAHHSVCHHNEPCMCEVSSSPEKGSINDHGVHIGKCDV